MTAAKNLESQLSNLSWGHLQTFLAVAAAGSISAAAKTLKLSQPTVSARIGELEKRLGEKLCIRRAQGVTLTDAGQRVLDRASAMNALVHEIDVAARERELEAQGRVRLLAPDGVAAIWIAPRLAPLLSKNPGLKLSLDVGLWQQMPVWDDLDVSLSYEKPRLPSAVVEVLAHVHYAPFASKGYIEKHGVPRAVEDYAQHRLVRHVAQIHQQETWSEEANAVAPLKDVGFETNSSTAMMAALRGGAGLGLIPTYAIEKDDTLKMVGDKPFATLQLYLSYDRDAARAARVALVIAWLRELFSAKAHPCFRQQFIPPGQLFPAKSQKAS